MKAFRERIAGIAARAAGLDPAELSPSLEVPPDPSMGDLALPCFRLARSFRKAPPTIASDLAPLYNDEPLIERVEARGAYLNFFLSVSEVAATVLAEIQEKGPAYGGADGPAGRIIIDYSSPNIAKPFSIGHLRSTIIGHALVRHLRHLGHEVIGINHLGDWGTQFGMVMAGYDLWGEGRPLDAIDVSFLLDLYVRYNKKTKEEPEAKETAREWFRRLEEGDDHARKLWEVFREVSLDEARRIYRRLGIGFEHYTGESFYNDRLDSTVATLREAGLLVESDGAQVVDLSDEKLPPCLIQKSDGATLYATRDISAVLYRLEEFEPDRILYVVGAPQKLHFRQLFSVMQRLDPSWKGRLVHVDFGHYRLAEGKMQTRTGNVVYMEDVLDRGVTMAKQLMEESARGGGLTGEEASHVAEQVALGAILFGDLSNDRTRDVLFDWRKALDFKGDTGPYVQYTCARTSSILRKAGEEVSSDADVSVLTTGEEREVLMHLARYPESIRLAMADYKPHITATFLLDLAKSFNRFYHANPVLKSEPNLRKARLLLTSCVGTVLRGGLSLLGIPAPERM